VTQQRIVREQPTAVKHQGAQQLAFGWCEANLFAVAANDLCGQVDPSPTANDHWLVTRSRPPQVRL
jgi:hypothetical protein